MPHEVQGVVSRAKGEPVSVKACGVCHVEHAFERVHKGDVLRSVVTW